MLFRFELGKRYLDVFAATLVAALVLTVVGAIAFGYKGALWGFPMVMIWLTASQLWSGIALDGKWVAKHSRGTPAFLGMIIWGFLLPVSWASYVGWMVLIADGL